MKYIIYDKYNNAQSLLNSTKTLFSLLGLEIVKPNMELADCGGYWARLAQRDDLLHNVAYNLALSNAMGATLVFLEEDAYANALYARSIIESDSDIIRELESKYLHKFNLLYESKAQMSYLPDLLNTIDIAPMIKKHFHTFCAAIVRGAYQGHLPISTNHRIYEQIGLKVIDTPLTKQYYAHLMPFDSQSALYNSAKMFFDIADLGVDFILTYSLSQFELLEGKRSKLCRAYNRDNIGLNVLFLPQVILLAFGEEERDKLGFAYHKQKVELI
ncbi:HdrB C-terminal domain-containing protein [Helicobacter marmotae]|uniref:HdrB-like C-terminal domain-containing protein n=1 Tax=Helicobacter marmotae TaxID=152490 RepID=A0A3D8I4C5_9HELI|nr:hypothetical protein [Helicobacter marmotae]RDU59998.1 hypothetical protein CQA63_04395 [Helicobacter marmotae]